MRPGRVDALVAAALGLASLVQVLVDPIAARPVGVIIALGSTVPIAWRRVYPAGAALAGSLPWLIPADGYLWLGYVAAFVLYFTLGSLVEDLPRVSGVVVAGVAMSVVAGIEQDAVLGEYFGAAVVVIAPTLVGRIVRRQRTQAKRLADLAHQLDLERERGMRAAVTEERARIARELHDVVAHGLSVIGVQADAAEAALDADRPELAGAPLRTIRDSTHDAMSEMRRLLGVLRADGAMADLDPQPGLEQLPALLDRVRSAGVPVTLETYGDRCAMPASVDLSAYRIVQEALTNVGRHAPGAGADVSLTWSSDSLRLAVRNAAGSLNGNGNSGNNGGGHGLVGMRERVRMLGGDLRTGPVADGGFAVEAVLPLGDAE